MAPKRAAPKKATAAKTKATSRTVYQTATESEYETEVDEPSTSQKSDSRTSDSKKSDSRKSNSRNTKSDSPVVTFASAPAAKSLKLPPFSSREIDFWFNQVEAAFRNGNVTDDQSKFDFIIMGLDSDICSEIQDVLENPPRHAKYDCLKSCLQKRLKDSEDKKISRILDHTSIGDRTPSQFLRLLRKESKISDSRVLKGIWKKALPANVRLSLAGRSDDLDSLAAIADEIMDEDEAIASIRKSDSPKSYSRESDPRRETAGNLEKSIELLSKTLEKVVTDVRDLRMTSSKSNIGSRKLDSGNPKSDSLCHYHATYGAEARKCRDPCSYKPGNGSGQQ